jgi:hypothetical protein
MHERRSNVSISQVTQPTDKRPVTPPIPPPYGAEDAAALLGIFCDRAVPIVSRGPGIEHTDSDRAAILAAPLVAIAGQLERLGDLVEEALVALMTTRTAPGKTHSVDWYLERDRVRNQPFVGQDGFE